MDNNMFQRLKELVTQHQNIGVIIAPNPTFDEMAAGLGMYLALKQMGKNVSVSCPTDPTVALSSLVGIDKVGKVLGGIGGDLVISLPYKDGEIEKVRYTTENGSLNFILEATPKGISFNQSDVKYQQSGSVPSLLFLMGITDANQITPVVNPASLSQTTVVNMDNKQTNTGFGTVVHVSPRFSSICEMVADFLTLLEPQIELDVDTSQDLLSGILAATNDFEAGRGSYLAFEMAGILMKKGAVRAANGPVAKPQATPMPTQNYFPPQQQAPVAPMQQPVAPVQQAPQPAQPMQQQFSPVQPAPVMQQPAMPAQPVQEQYQQQVQPSQEQVAQPAQPIMDQPVQQAPQGQPPADWLTPKVYKGSTVL